MDARLVSLETEEENAFVIENLLWIGFFGEAYTGLFGCQTGKNDAKNMKMAIEYSNGQCEVGG